MDNTNGDQLEQAWRSAPDAHVQRALGSPDDYSPQAYSVIQAEAARRGIVAMGTLHPDPFPESVYLRLLAPAGRFLWDHRLFTAFLLAAGLRAASTRLAPAMAAVNPLMYAAGYLALLTICMSLLAFPLRSYSLAARVTLAGCLGQIPISLASFLINQEIIGPGIWFWLFSPVVQIVVGWGLPFAMIVLVIVLRRKYAPVFAPGHCRRCGYDLKGLPQPRCPECGTPFVSAIKPPSSA